MVAKAFYVCTTIGLVILANLQVAEADVIWIKGQAQPFFGIVDAADDQQISFRQTDDGKSFESRKITQSSVRVVVINHDEQRLAALTQGNWQSWLDYAEELDSQKRDPVARNLAIKLLIVVVAHSDDREQREVALSKLVSLSRSEEERSKLEQLRFLETGEKLPVQSVVADVNHSQQAKASAADLVRKIRLQENTDGKLGDDSAARVVISSFEDICSWQELVQIAKANRIDGQSVKRLVALELALRMTEKDSVPTQSRKQWHELAQRIGTSQLSLATIDSVTEFDPWATSFANGKWSRP